MEYIVNFKKENVTISLEMKTRGAAKQLCEALDAAEIPYVATVNRVVDFNKSVK